MKIINTHEAKTQFSRLLRRVAAGERVTIASRGVPVAQLVPMPTEPRRKLGDLKGQIDITNEFDAPLPGHLLDAFEGRTAKRSKTRRPKKSS